MRKFSSEKIRNRITNPREPIDEYKVTLYDFSIHLRKTYTRPERLPTRSEVLSQRVRVVITIKPGQ